MSTHKTQQLRSPRFMASAVEVTLMPAITGRITRGGDPRSGEVRGDRYAAPVDALVIRHLIAGHPDSARPVHSIRVQFGPGLVGNLVAPALCRQKRLSVLALRKASQADAAVLNFVDVGVAQLQQE